MISETNEYKTFLSEFDSNLTFISELSELIRYNGGVISFITDKNIYEVDTELLDSAVQTLRSIKLCCSIGSFSDANTLVRKLRDDVILYVFILEIVQNRKFLNEEDLSKFAPKNNKFDADRFLEVLDNIRFNDTLSDDERAIDAWLSNTVDKLPNPIKKRLSFENYMKRLKQNTYIADILSTYNLEDYWEKLRHRLNDYVHNNGKKFTIQNSIVGSDKALEILLKNINTHISYISSFFLVLILMVDAKLIGSSDLIDYLDANVEPPEGCQYLIAPFAQEFIDTKVVKLHSELKQYLQANNNNGMKID